MASLFNSTQGMGTSSTQNEDLVLPLKMDSFRDDAWLVKCPFHNKAVYPNLDNREEAAFEYFRG